MSEERNERRRLTLRGDEHDLYATAHARLRAVVGSAVNTSDANIDDACSFAWLKLLANQPRRATAFGWLAKVAIREAWRVDRAERARGTITGDLNSLEIADEANRAADRLALEETLEALAAIHPRKRAMLVMHTLGFTHAEIAAEHGISPQRARELVYRARLQLAKLVGRPGPDPRSRH
jgi:DNA-directed RNA polymerase specialized sigma24 family protein